MTASACELMLTLPPGLAAGPAVEPRLDRAWRTLADAFGAALTLIDGQSGAELLAGDVPLADWNGRIELCQAVAQSGRAEIVADEPPLVLLAVPLPLDRQRTIVALAACRTSGCPAGPAPRRLLALDEPAFDEWLAGQPQHSAAGLLQLAGTAAELWRSREQSERLAHEVQSLSLHLSNTYEEISLLHRLTRNLRLSQDDASLAQQAIEWLADVLPAAGLLVYLTPVEEADALVNPGRSAPLFLVQGEPPLAGPELLPLLESLGLVRRPRPLILNPATTAADGWAWPAVRQAVLVPLCEGENTFGWLAALNHREGAEFGSVEASLLASVAAILGIHCGNTELYRQQRSLLAGVVRALSSAIDAKDPYTCGHSDRVARVAARLAQELGCSPEQVSTIYLCGLLHDVGKIGIDDQVLRKAGRLTGAEFEHIKTHTEIGFRILQDIKQFDEVLPVVLHHHEQWDGHGYPRALASHDIPFFARIVAVADAFDAMGSDRPYRQGMPEAKLDAILREGSGTQWDPAVIEAFFRARDDIRAISASERAGLDFDLRHWV
jgi:putative nucleotidyltransferase with HDIG domain